MLLNLICVLSALAALGICAGAGGFSTLAWLWLLPLGFVGCALLSLLACLVLLLITEKHTDPEGEFETDDPYIRGIIRWYAPAVFRLLGCKIQASGTEKLPADGRFLLVSNHLADLDPGIFFTVFPNNQLSFIAKKEVQHMPIVGILMRRILCQFVNRENDREALKTILKCISILKENKANVAVFPEGKKSTDRYLLHHFRPGVFKMAQKANVPIVVCTLRGTQNILPNAKKLRRTDIRLNLVEVIPAEELKGITTVDIAHRVHTIMAADLGAENVAED
jgi:1-acyl-sn-glycerol-3-phosphate acyltransferase